MLLPRRNPNWPAQPKCRNKGKAVIVRIGSINPSSQQDNPASPLARWVRRMVSIVALVASTVALGLIMEGQYSQFLFDESRQGPDAVAPGGDSARNDQPVMVLTPIEEIRYRALSEFVANRYRVSQIVAYDLVSLTHRVGHQLQLDPLLIIAVIAVESRFNPIAESVAGAKGLMQIIPKYHGDKLEEYGGEKAVFDPAANIQVGSQILKEYIRNTGNLGSALQMYAGALSDFDDQYTSKVLNEKNRLQQVVSESQRRRSAPAPVRTAAASARNGNGFVLPLD